MKTAVLIPCYNEELPNNKKIYINIFNIDNSLYNCINSHIVF